MTITPGKIISGVMSSALSVLINDLFPLFICVLVFECADFVTGVWKSKVVSKRDHKAFAFESIKAWRTIYKIVFIFIGIAMSELIDSSLLPFGTIHLAKYFTAFCCGVEFWSFLENAAVISNHPIFRMLKKYMKNKVDDAIGNVEQEEDSK